MTTKFLKRSVLSLLLASSLTVMQAHAAADTKAVLDNYVNIVHATYEDTLADGKALQKAVNDFIAQPSAQGLEAARKAWLASRESYGQTEAFRFYGGPIDDNKDVEGRLNPWPLDEAYVDYVKGKPNAGIINNPKMTLSAERLVKLNSRGGEANIATGYHAVEFLLWGQDQSATGPGDRQYTDFVDGQGKNADRRRQYLKIVTDQVVADLEYLNSQWVPGQQNYRAKFLKEDPEAALRKVLTGVAVLSSAELAGERMQVALDNQDQEDEHSCFSDNTHRDIVTNALGMRNVVLGQYKRTDGSMIQGPGLKDLVDDKALSDKLATDFDASVKAAEAIQAPFDQEIIGKKDAPGRKRVQASISSLKKQTQTLVEVSRALGIRKLSVDLPK